MESKELQEHVTAAVKQYVQTVQDKNARIQLLEFTGASVNSVRRWRNGEHPPVGVHLLQVYFMMLEFGFLKELMKLDPTVEFIRNLVIFTKISLEEAAVYLGQTQTSSALASMRDEVHPTDVVSGQELQDLHDRYDKEIAAATAELKASFRRVVGAVTSAPPVPGVPASTTSSGAAKASAPPTAVNMLTQDPGFKIVEIAGHLAGAAPYLRYLVSDVCTDEQRQQFRELFGGQEAYNEFYRNANALRGKRARQQVLEGRPSHF